MSEEKKRKLHLPKSGEQSAATSRVEQIRQRRSTTAHSTRPAGRTSRRKIASAEPPPVFARSSMARSAQAGRASQKARRRFDVALNSQGSEMRLPAFPVIRTGWRVVSFLLVGFLGFVLYQFWTSPGFQVDEAEVLGLQRLNGQDVNSVLDLDGQTIFTIDPEAVHTKIEETFPEFSSVAVQVSLPDTVAISVTERVPVLLWRSERRSELVDAEGIAFPLRSEAGADAFPLVEAEGDPPALFTGAEETQDDAAEELSTSALAPSLGIPSPAQQFLTKEMVSAILLLSVQTPDGAPVVYDPSHGLGWQDRRGWKVYFGDLKEMEQKLVVYNALLQRLKSNDLKPVLISVEYVHHPYYRLEP
jgi:cell division protein FtsQ